MKKKINFENYFVIPKNGPPQSINVVTSQSQGGPRGV